MPPAVHAPAEPGQDGAPSNGAELMRLNSYLSWNSVTLSLMRPLEKFSTSASFSNSANRPSMRVRLMTSSPTAFIMRSSRSSPMRTDFDCAMPTGMRGAATGSGASIFGSSACAGNPRRSSLRPERNVQRRGCNGDAAAVPAATPRT